MRSCPACNRKFDDANTFCPYDGQELVMVAAHDMSGRLIDNKYLIESKIARGGTGTVYRAMHVQLNVPMAVKILHNDRISDALAVERFRREAFAAMQVRHPNAIAVFDFGVTTDNLVYVVMELLRGMSLRQKLKQMCYVSLIDVNNIMQQICAAVAVAHKRKIVHRDLKPENVFLHRDGEEEVVKVLDFGLAKLRGLVEDGDSPALTRDGLVIGTPLYMSPEQSRGRSVDRRSDIYSLGVMLYEMLTGNLPFRGNSLAEIAIKHATEKPRPIYDIRPTLPAVVNAAVMHALEKIPKNRPDTITEWAASLQAAVKAVTEGQFRDLFLNASDEDLEAAILLTGEMGQLPQSAETSDLDPFKLNETGEVAKKPKLPINLTSASTSAAQQILPSPNLTQESEMLTLNEQSISQENLPAYIFAAAQESIIVLQSIMGNLAAQQPLTESIFRDLERATKSLNRVYKQTKNMVIS
jgi:serine/threonine protein kinase